VEGVDKDNPIVIYPIKLKDYDRFEECSKLLYLSKQHFEAENIPLLVLLFASYKQLQMTIEEIIESFTTLFSLVTHKEVQFMSSENYEGFIIDNANIISTHNYETIREIIMKQNLMFEQKIYKNPIIQEWANKVIMARQKKNAKITLEDMITTVKNNNGLTYEQIMNQSIYQLHADFYRIGQIKQWEQSSLFATVMEKVEIQSFAASIDIFKNPYDDLFVSSDKLNNLNKAMKPK
jgi:hypothetical protein